MKVTILKTNNSKIAVSAELKIVTLEDLIIFSNKMGFNQSLDAFVQDFNEFQDVTYSMELQNDLG